MKFSHRLPFHPQTALSHLHYQAVLCPPCLQAVQYSVSLIEIHGDSMSSLLLFYHADNILLPNPAWWWNFLLYWLLPPYSFPLPIPSSLPFSLSVLGGCQILTLEAPLITEKAPCMYNGYTVYIYSKDEIRSPFVKPPWSHSSLSAQSAILRSCMRTFKNIVLPCLKVQALYCTVPFICMMNEDKLQQMSLALVKTTACC
jgi:hypothetical protein